MRNQSSDAVADVKAIARLRRLVGTLGVVLILGGLGHSTGIAHLYLTQGVPHVERVLLDLWVAEAQLAGGAFYVTAFRAMRAGTAGRDWSIAGAVTVLTCAVPFLPVLFLRAPAIFSVPQIVYAALSLWIVFGATRRPMNIGAPTSDRIIE